MELTNEQIKIANNWLKDKEERIVLNNRCEELYKDFVNGNLSELTPHWHSVIDNIDLDLQPHKLDKELCTGCILGFIRAFQSKAF